MTPEAVIIESMFRVVNKNGEDVDFKLNKVQRKLDENLTGRDIIPKARQPGISTYFLARYTAACLSKRNTRAVIISHEGEATQRLLNRCHYFVENIRGPKPVVGRESINVITFPKMNSMIYIGTAGSRKFGRGDTISHLHCSEYAYWPDPKRLLDGLLQAVPINGEVAIESTGNGKGNDYHRRAKRAFEGKSQYKCHFFGLHDIDEYAFDVPPELEEQVLNSLNEEWEEVTLYEKYGLSLGQILWRRAKLEEMDFDLVAFKQEYPITFDDCFQAKGHSIFHRVNYVPTDKWKDQGNGLWTLDPHPISGYTYCIGADPSGGTGNDNAAAEIFCLETMEQVGEYAHNLIEPDVFGLKLKDLGKAFNNAFIVVEANNHGPVTIDMLRRGSDPYPEILIYDMLTAGTDFEDKTLMKMGFRTTSRTKPIMIGRLRTAIAHDWAIHSPLLSDELSTFIEHENGKLGAQEGCHDDRVIASACCMMGIERAGIYAKQEKVALPSAVEADKFSLDYILKEMKKRAKGFPISPQHEGAFKF